MKKTLFVIAAMLLLMNGLRAQEMKIEKSAGFDEPEYGWNKLLQLKNGNTLFFHSTKKDGIDLVIYNKERKQIATRTLESKLWDIEKMKRSIIEGLYEINGEVVLFIAQGEERVPVLYRMRINCTTGAIIKEDELGHLAKTGMGEGYAVAFGHEASNIYVEKDPQSDCYAVILFNSFAHDRSERVRVIHYDGDHKILTDRFYESPNGQFKYVSYIGAAVDGNKSVYIAAYGHNGSSSDVSSRVIVSRLNAGDTGFVHKLLDFSEDFKDTRSVMLYNHTDNKLQLMTLSYTSTKHQMFSGKSKQTYLILMSYIDPQTLDLISVKPLVGEKVNAYGVANIDKDYEFTGLPQNMILNKDNTTTVLFEETQNVTTTYGANGANVSQKTMLGPIGISELSDTGAEIKGYAISKKQQADGILPLLYQAGKQKGYFQYPQSIGMQSTNVNQFLSYDYINTAKGRYVIFNDLPQNMEKDEDEQKRKTVSAISSTSAVCYKLNDPKMDKFYLFGEPDGKKSGTFCYIGCSDYNPDINTYTTMIIERDGRDKQAKIAWITFP